MRSSIHSLVALLALLSFLSLYEAVPVRLTWTNDVKLHSLPLRKIPTRRDGEHPVLAFERHQTAAIKRIHGYKRMAPPTEMEFQQRSIERRKMIETNPKLDKRTWIPPIPLPDLTNPEHQKTSKRVWWRPTTPPVASDVVGTSGSPVITPLMATGRVNAVTKNAQAQATTTVLGGLDYIIEGNDIGYLCEIQIGSPSQTFLMLMDTGSADTWVPSTSCPVAQCGNHSSLGPKSATLSGSDCQFEVTYGSGNVAGVLAADTMTIAGMSLENHAMGVTLVESVQFSASKTPFDGLMGLALSKLSNQGVSTPLESLASTGLIEEPILGIALGRFTDGENNGELVFGHANTLKLDASTTQTLPLTSNDGFWQVEMAAVGVDGAEAVGARQAILDTGTSLVIAPPADATAFHAKIVGALDVGGGMFSIPCTIDQMITMSFGQAVFQIDVRDLIFQPLSADLKGDCLSFLSAGVIKDDTTWLLGDTFLKNVYMTTNARDLTVQLLARTDAPNSSSRGVVNAVGSGVDDASPGESSNVSTGTTGSLRATALGNGAVQASGSGSAKATSAELSQIVTSNSTRLSLIGAVAALLAGGSNL